MKTNRLAALALICATCVPGLLIGGVLATLFGTMALDEIDASQGREGGKSLARWAVGLGFLNVLGSCVLIVVVVAALSK